jgi:O-antigen ligase
VNILTCDRSGNWWAWRRGIDAPRGAHHVRVSTVRLADTLTLTMVLTFLVFLMRPGSFDPLHLGFDTFWPQLCYAFAVPMLLVQVARGTRFVLTTFDYALAAYLLFVLVTWPTASDRRIAGTAIVELMAQIALFYAFRLLLLERQSLGAVVIVALTAGIAVLEMIALGYHAEQGLSVRLIEYARPAGWNGRAGLGFVGAIQFAILLGIWQRARSRALQAASACLLLGVTIELVFLYSRLAWMAAFAAFVVGALASFRIGGTRRIVVAVGVVLVLLRPVLVGNPAVVRLAKVSVGLEPSEGQSSSPDARFALWRNAATIIRAHVIMGVGLGNFVQVHARVYPRAYPQLDPAEDRPAHPHNMFLQQGAEVGILGGLSYVALWAVALWTGWRASSRRTREVQPATCAFYALVVIVVTNMGENMFLNTVATARVRLHSIAWILLAIVVAEWSRMLLDEDAGEEPVK